MKLPRLELNAVRHPRADLEPGLSGSGHFTAMQVRGGRTLGMISIWPVSTAPHASCSA
jgi:hypothetical protein